jgi:WD40 repeat protein
VLDGQDGGDIRYPIGLLLPINSACFISASDLGIIKYWQHQHVGHQCIQTWKSDDLGQVTAMMRLPNDRLWVGLVDGELQVWTLARSGRIEAVQLEAHGSMVFALGKLSDGRLVSASLYDMKVWRGDGDTYRSLQKIPCMGGDITAMVVLPGDRIATGACDKTIKVWGDGDSNGFVCTQTLTENVAVIRALAVMDNELLVAIVEDENLAVWSEEGGCYRSLKVITTANVRSRRVGKLSCLAPTSDGVIATDEKGYLFVFE